MASTYLTRTPSSAGNRKTFTFSLWFKRAKLSEQVIFNSTGGGIGEIRLNLVNDNLKFVDVQSGSTNISYITNRKFRDTSGWYHLVLAVDTTAAGGNRIKIYINGEQETSFSSSTEPNQNYDTTWNTANVFQIASNQNPGDYFDGAMSHFHFIDGTAYTPSAFGETDTTTGEWKAKTSPSVTYGTNGFFILKDGNSVTDQSGNSNNFTVSGGTLTDLKDNPDNTFATWNPLNYDFANNPSVFANCNTKVSTNQETAHNTGVSTLAMPVGNGKFYAEIKYNNSSTTTGAVGVVDSDKVSEIYYQNYNLMNENVDTSIGRVLYAGNGTNVNGGGVENQSWGATYTGGDIIQIACDMENGAIYFGKNGTWQNSGDPTSGASKTGAIDMSAQSWYTGTSFWHIWCGKKATNNIAIYEANFGNGYFGTTAVASAGTNASGNGIFEYDVPTGYTALSTKGLNL